MYKGVSNGVTTVAVKVMSEVGAGLNPAKAARQLEAFKREVHILKACHDKNIVQFIGACLLARCLLSLSHAFAFWLGRGINQHLFDQLQASSVAALMAYITSHDLHRWSW